jgi:hypothetical protein
VLVVASLWLVVTVAVAFLREAKAVRVSRQLLAEGKVQEAWSTLRPFFNENPDHAQAVFLCGQETVRLGLKAEAKQCLEKNAELSPELAETLQKDYSQVLTQKARTLGCNAAAFSDLLMWTGELGGNYDENVIAGLDGMVEACRSQERDQETEKIAALLAEQGRTGEMVRRGYVPAIQRAVAQGEYGHAEVLANQAYQLGEGAELVEAALDPEREKVEATVATLVRLRDTLRADPRSSSEGYWCFPADVPASVQSARDGWGNAVLYNPLNPFGTDEENRCHQGFELTSYGADGVGTDNPRRGSPIAEIVCRFTPWGESWELPSEFWRKRD